MSSETESTDADLDNHALKQQAGESTEDPSNKDTTSKEDNENGISGNTSEIEKGHDIPTHEDGGINSENGGPEVDIEVEAESSNDSDESSDDESNDSSSSEEEDAATARARRQAEAKAKAAADAAAEENKKLSKKGKKRGGGFLSRVMGQGAADESSSSSSDESEDSVELFEVQAETIQECIDALKLIEHEDSDWDILLDAPSDWDSDDSENKPTAPILRSSCGTLTIETTQIREDCLRALLESREALKDAEKELKMHEEDDYMKYFYDTLDKLRIARDKTKQRVIEEENRLELYSQKDEGAIKLGAALRFNEQLMSLTMCDAEIGPVGATALAAAIKVHPTLTHLSLKHNPLLAEGAEAIFRATRRNGVCGLAELDLYDCSIGPEGATMLAAQLYKNKTLEDLRLRYNNFGPAGATAIASMLMENRTILDLDIMLNNVKMAGGLAFERVLKHTVVAEIDKGEDISFLKKVLKAARQKIEDPFYGDSEEAGAPEQLSDGSDEGTKETSGDKPDSETDEGLDPQETGGESKKMETKTKAPVKKKKLTRRQRKRMEAEKLVKDRKIRQNIRFWMRSTISSYGEASADYQAQFMATTKRKSCSVVLFAGTKMQCTKAMDYFDNDHCVVALNEKNNVVKEINLGQNDFERDFRRRPEQMKRLLGSTLKGVWQEVTDFFRPTIMNF